MSDHILLVSGDAQSPPTIIEVLTQRGYQIACGSDRATIQQMLAAQTPDLILLDHPWPDEIDKRVLEHWVRDPLLMLCGESGIVRP